MRVFISSTVFDLLDVRAELTNQLRGLGIVPVLSDDKLSDFRVKPDADSIETCLVNVASCDEIIVILDRRYGPRLGPSGYDNISATHLEYRKAKELKKTVHFYVRDRLDAEYSIWKRNGRNSSIEFSWIAKDFGLLEMLDEHSKLSAKSDQSNWYSTFSNSIDLKAAITKHLETRILPEKLVEAIQSNAFPLFDIHTKASHEGSGIASQIIVSSEIHNVGGTPAFNCRVFWEENETADLKEGIVAPNQSLKMTFIYRLGTHQNGIDRHLIVQYESPIGISVRDRFRVGAYTNSGALVSGGTLVDRQFRRAKPLKLRLDDT